MNVLPNRWYLQYTFLLPCPDAPQGVVIDYLIFKRLAFLEMKEVGRWLTSKYVWRITYI